MVDALHRLIRRIGAQVRGFYAAVGLFLLLGLGLAALAAGLFALLAEGVLAGTTRAFDEAVVAWAQAHRTPWLDWLALAGAVLGSGAVAWVVLVAGSLALWRTRHRLSVLLLWISLLGGRLLAEQLKLLLGRARPPPVGWELEVFGRPVGFPSSPSFPSGHAVTSVVVFGTLAYLVVRLEPTVRTRRVTLALAAALILLIGAFAIEMIRSLRHRRPDIAREEKDLEQGLRPVREALPGGEG